MGFYHPRGVMGYGPSTRNCSPGRHIVRQLSPSEQWSEKRDHFPPVFTTMQRRPMSVPSIHRQTAAPPTPPPPPHILAFTATLRKQQKELEEVNAKQAILHAKAQRVEEGEKCSSYFLRLQTKCRQDTTMHAINVSATETTTTSASILAATARSFTPKPPPVIISRISFFLRCPCHSRPFPPSHVRGTSLPLNLKMLSIIPTGISLPAVIASHSNST